MSTSLRQEFCVRWNSHLGSIGESFPQLLAGQRFVDVTLACEGHQVHCHRLVLAACSSYFESILAENPCKHPVVILPSDIRLWEIQALVDFMYKGEVNVTQAGLPQLLRCAEQLRIKGLYGSDAALNLEQLKALTSKTAATGVGGDGSETEDTATNSTTTTASSTHNIRSLGGALMQQQLHTQIGVVPQELLLKKDLVFQQQTNGVSVSQQHAYPQNQQKVHLQKQLHLQLQNQELATATLVKPDRRSVGVSLPPNVEESADESTTMSNAYDRYEEGARVTPPTGIISNPHGQQIIPQSQQSIMQLDSTIEDDHNYVVAQPDEEDSYCTGDTEHEASTHSSLLIQQQNLPLDTSASFKRVRRSEASLAQAAKCVSKGQTFQTVSNLFNIPVSTIRFYMARKGILPKRKRGRGASNANTSSLSATTAVVSGMANTTLSLAQAMPDRKHHVQTGSPILDSGSSTVVASTPFHLMGYKLSEQQGAMI